MAEPVCIDAAGAFVGGAKRFLSVLDKWIADTHADVRVIGRGRRLTPQWLVQRELAARHSRRVIALNNVSFAHTAGLSKVDHRTVLLRNALHFSSPREFANLNFVPSRELRLQTPVVRRAVRFADRVVVPSTAMAERVLAVVPTAGSRIEVIHHPVDPKRWNGSPPVTGDLLVPVVNSPYKQMQKHLETLKSAVEAAGFEGQIRVTSDAAEYTMSLAQHPQFTFVGMQTHEELDGHWRDCAGVYFPPTVEAFGFPLAEARVNGRFVLAPDTSQSREIAGGSLLPFREGDTRSISEALRRVSVETCPEPDPGPFDPDTYFRELIGPVGEWIR